MSCANGSSESGPVIDGDQEQLLMPRKARPTVGQGMCNKCRISRSTILRNAVSNCTPCFLSSVYVRFAKILHTPLYGSASSGVSQAGEARAEGVVKKKAVPLQTSGRPGLQPGNALIPLSGGAGSMTLLEILLSRNYIGRDSDDPEGGSNGRPRPRERKWVWRRGWVVHVDFGGIIPGLDDLPERLRTHVSLYANPNVRLLSVRIEDAFDPSFVDRLKALHHINEDNLARSVPAQEEPDETTPLSRLRTFLASLPPASHPHILSLLLNTLLTICASHLPNISHMLLGETSTRQAQNIVSGTATGRGWSLPLDLAAVRTLRREEGAGREMVRIKPMRDTMYKEVAFYCHVKRMQTINWRRWETVAQPRSTGSRPGLGSSGGESRGKGGIKSLEQLTEDFITSLGVTHPSTVSTISRTGSKLVFRGAGVMGKSLTNGSARKVEVDVLCPLCGLPAEPSSSEWKARTALTALKGKGKDRAIEATVQDANQAVGAITADKSDLAEKLCYACLTAMVPASGIKPGVHDHLAGLPYWVKERMKRPERLEMSRAAMKDSIQDFMLEEDET